MLEQQRTIELNGHDLAFAIQGAGTPIIFLHGIGGCRHFFTHYTFPSFTSLGMLIAPDLPGYDDTEPLPASASASEYAEFIADFIDSLGVGKCHLVGLSFGGTIALHIALRRPDLVRSVCASGPVVNGRTMFSPLVKCGLVAALKALSAPPCQPMAVLLRRVLAREVTMTTIGRLTNPVDLELLGPEYPALAAHAASSLSPQTYARNILDLLQTDIRQDLKNLAVPVLITDGHAIHRKSVTRDHTILDLFPGSHSYYRGIANAGHLAPYTQPGELAHMWQEFRIAVES